MWGRDTLDLAVDPPPSLWVEIDNRGRSASKLPVYARLGVPEVWRYRPLRGTLWFGRLAGDGYEELAASFALPGLTPGTVLQLLADGAATPATAWSRWLETVGFPANRETLRPAGGS